MEAGFIMIEDSPSRQEPADPGPPDPEWTLQPYTFRARVPVPLNDQITKDAERRVSKGICKILRWDVDEGRILTVQDVVERLHKDVSELNVRNCTVGNERVQVWQRRLANGSLEWGLSATPSRGRRH